MKLKHNEYKNFKFNFTSYEDVKKYFVEKKLNKVILFSQARSGSTFVTQKFSKYLGFEDKNIYTEEYFYEKHFSYLKHFVKKHNNFFLNTNEYLFKRHELNLHDILFIYLYREPAAIISSYEKAKKKGYYMGWEEFYSKYKKFFPKINQNLHVSYFNHHIWETQFEKFDHSLILNYESFSNFPGFEINRSTYKNLKQINYNKTLSVKLYNEINFNIIEKLYFFFRRKLESRKKFITNY
tara:strand:+ start:68 stop:781 length:714 start_codon:yes stop_codon:yes gene_type:complete